MARHDIFSSMLGYQSLVVQETNPVGNPANFGRGSSPLHPGKVHPFSYVEGLSGLTG